MKYKPHEYVCIAAWGRRMGSFDYYIKDQQRKAAQMGAPLTAIYERDGHWQRAEEIVNPHTRKMILGSLYVEEEHGQVGTEYDVSEDRFDRLPRVCAAFEFTEGKAVIIHRGEMGYTEAPEGFDVDTFNAQRRITNSQIEAMLNGSMFGWSVPAADPANCDGEGI